MEEKTGEARAAAREKRLQEKKALGASLQIVLLLTLLEFAFSPGLLIAGYFNIELGPLTPRSWPLPFAGAELALALAMLLASKNVLENGLRRLLRAPSADSLVLVSALSAVAASLLLMAKMYLEDVNLFHQLLFTPLGILLTFTLGGKYLEARLATREPRPLEKEGAEPQGTEEMRLEQEAARQKREEEAQRQKESEARYQELEALRAEERRRADAEARKERGEPPLDEENDEPTQKIDASEKKAAPAASAPLLAVTNNAALRFLVFGFLLAIAGAAFWQSMELDILSLAAFFFATLFLACPAALFFAAPLTLPSALRKCRAQKIIISDAGIFDTLTHVSAIAITKSGGITEGRPFLATIVGEGLSDGALLGLAASIENGLPHPLARVLVSTAMSRGARFARVSAANSIPGQGVEALSYGRPVRIGKREWLQEEGVEVSNSLITKGDQFATKGKITVYLATGNSGKGILVFSDEIRRDVRRTIRLLEALNVQVVMLTGDSRSTAKRIAKEAGVSVWRSDLTPADKAKEVQLLQAHGHTVALLVSDPQDKEVFSKADVVISMTDEASDSDIIITSDDSAYIPQLLTLARRTAKSARLGLALAFVCSLLAIALSHASLFYLGDLRFLPLLSILPMLLGAIAMGLTPWRIKSFSFTPHTLDY